MRVYGIKVPRGPGASYIVACEHRGPATLGWEWKQRGSAVRITVRLESGHCFPPGTKVAGTLATFTFTLS